jgi:hypothetical protein
MSFLAANAPFRAKPAEEPGHEIAPPHSVGRILPSLIDGDTANRSLRDSSTSDQEAPSTLPTATRLQGGPRHRVRTTKPPRTSQRSAEADAPAADNGAKTHASDDGVQPSQTATAQLRHQRNATGLKIRTKESARKTASISSEQNQVVSLAEGQLSTAEPNAKANSLSNVQEARKPVRKRRIMGRYVLGDELKPGERWKRSLRWKRRGAANP